MAVMSPYGNPYQGKAGDIKEKMERVRLIVQAMMQETVYLCDMEMSDYFGHRAVFSFERSNCKIAHDISGLAHGDNIPTELLAQNIVSQARRFMDERVQRDLGRALEQTKKAVMHDRVSGQTSMMPRMTTKGYLAQINPPHFEDAMRYATHATREKIPLPKVKTYRDEVQAKLDAWLK